MSRKNRKKEYQREIGLTLEDEGTATTIVMGESGIKALDENGGKATGVSINTEILYRGQNKKRVTAMSNSSTLDVDSLYNPNHFDKVFACDTNTKSFENDKKIAVSIISVNFHDN